MAGNKKTKEKTNPIKVVVASSNDYCVQYFKKPLRSLLGET